MKRPHLLALHVLAGLGLAFLPASAAARSSRNLPPPHYQGGDLPEPPAQALAWTAPEIGVPASYVSATATLFHQGLADPRGCEYRQIAVAIGNAGNRESGIAYTDGWVLPGYGAARFGICWNGLVYPLVSIGAPADLRADALAAIGHARRPAPAPTENEMVDWNTTLAVKGCLLLRLGEADLARDMWMTAERALHAPLDPSAAPEPDFRWPKQDPYLGLATLWAWGLFERTVWAHLRADDKLALAGARQLARLHPRLVAEQDRRLAHDPTYTEPAETRHEMARLWFQFLHQTPELLADHELRAVKPPHPPALAAIQNPALTRDERIRLLIEDLDEVAVANYSVPSHTPNFANSPIVAALVAQGPAAIEPLLAAMEGGASSRLTRSVSCGLFIDGLRLYSLRLPIRHALLALMKATPDAVGVPWPEAALSDREEALRFRLFWSHYGSVPDAERWYRQLADDHAEPATWTDAAMNIVHRDRQGHAEGETLRERTNPPVSQLLALRAADLTARYAQPPRPGDPPAFDPLEFLQRALKWDPAAALPSARELAKILYTRESWNPGKIARLTNARAAAGDLQALDEWCGWIQSKKARERLDTQTVTFSPLYRFPDHPAVRAFATTHFQDPTSPWWRPARASDSNVMEYQRLMVLPEVRLLWDQELQDMSAIGEVEMKGGRDLELRSKTTHSSYTPEPADGAIPVGTKVVFRACDRWALWLARIHGFPAFCPAWSVDRRDAAITTMRGLLASHGHALRYCDDAFSPGIRFEFPARTKPATADDVARGEAIFHRSGEKGVRVVPLPSRPLEATLAGDRRTRVLIWQAEETGSGADRRRLYGIVDDHSIRVVPASEVVMEAR